MTQDHQDPTPKTSGSAEGTSTTAANGGTAENASAKTAKTTKTASSRAPRRRHTSSRGRQTKESKDQQGQPDAKPQQDEQPAAATVATAEAPQAAEQSVRQESPATEIAEQVAAATPATTAPAPPASAGGEAAPRTTTRGRRGGGARRRGSKAEKAEQPDVQLVPVVSTPEPAPPESAAPEGRPELAPAAELLPLDAAILAHLDALSAAERQTAEAAGLGQPEQPTSAEAQQPAEEAPPRNRYRFDRHRSPAALVTPAPTPERPGGWRATPPTLMAPLPAEASESVAARNEAVAEAVSAEAAAADIAEPTGAIEPIEPIEATETVEAGSSAAPAAETMESPVATAEEAGAEQHEEQDEREGTAHRRRRRGRGRNGRTQEAETGEVEGDEHERQGAESPTARPQTPYAAPNGTVTYAHEYENNGYMTGMEGYDETGYSPYTPTPRARAPRSSAPASPASPATRRQESSWDMASAQQYVQEPASPFGAPEPSFARGFGPQSSGIAGPVHETQTRTRRGERGGEAPPMSANQLGAVLTNAIGQQTDRLLNELRRQQYPPSMTVALPAFPSTERIGVFVDVANLLYSARSQRMSIDFGRLLDFLRANRRLIRAHAYAPTNPDPHAEQTFLAAVKGVGYRITTKNYKTFASGARKADMDLDLCMDIVRLVDAGALDTVVLVSGDSDFLPLLEYCSDHGVRVEVAAFDDAAAMILRQSCDLFINLSQVDEIRA